MFCGYACIVYAMRGEFETAAPFIGFAIVLDMLDGRIARLTGTASEFGVEFDSLADVISFGIAPAILCFAWGLQPLGRLGWAAGFLFVTAAAMRLARFNIQSRPAATSAISSACRVRPPPACRRRRSSRFPSGLHDYGARSRRWRWCIVPAMLMVSTIRFRSFKTIDLRVRRPYSVLILIAAALCSSRASALRARRGRVHLSRVRVRRSGVVAPAAPPGAGRRAQSVGRTFRSAVNPAGASSPGSCGSRARPAATWPRWPSRTAARRRRRT